MVRDLSEEPSSAPRPQDLGLLGKGSNNLRPKRIVRLSFAIVLLIAAGGVRGHDSAARVGSLQSSHTSGKVPSGNAVTPKPATSHRQDKIAQAYDKLPISFEPNQGQAGKRVKFLSHGGGYLLLLSPSKAALVL